MSLVFTAFVASVLVAKAEKPDAFLSYVTLDGSQYIDTGIIGKTGVKVEADFKWSARPDVSLIGARAKPDTDTRFYPIHNYYVSGFGYGHGKFYYIDKGKFYVPTGKRYRIVSDFSEAGTATISLDNLEDAADAESYTVSLTPATGMDTGLPMYLGTMNIDGKPQSGTEGDLYSFKIWEKNAATGELELKRWYLPCVKDGVAALYDHVTETIFPSIGSKDFFEGGPQVVADPGEPDAFVEWIESDGATQYIDTGVYGNSDTSVDLDFEFRSLKTRTNTDNAVLASRWVNQWGDFRFYLAYEYKGYFCYAYGDLFDQLGFDDGEKPKVVVRQRYHLQSTLASTNQLVTVDGETFTTSKGATITPRTDGRHTTNRSLWLFANNTEKGDADGNRCYSHVRVYSLKIEQDGVLLRDFVPCVKNGEAGLYDKVTGCCFLCANRESVIDPITQAGPVTDFAEWPTGKELRAELTKLDYVQSNGVDDYIDTGVIGGISDGEEMEIYLDMEWAELPNDGCAIGARAGDSRFYGYHYWVGYPAGGTPDGHKCGYGDVITIPTPPAPKVEANVRYVIDTKFAKGRQSMTVSRETTDGWASETVTATKAKVIDTKLNLYLFGLNWNGALTSATSMRVRRLVIRRNGQRVRDLRPVSYRGIAFLWDDVTDTPFMSAARRYSLIPGPELGPYRTDSGLLIIFR